MHLKIGTNLKDTLKYKMEKELTKIQVKMGELHSPDNMRLEYLLSECSAFGIVHIATRKDWKGSRYQQLARDVVDAMYKDVYKNNK